MNKPKEHIMKSAKKNLKTFIAPVLVLLLAGFATVAFCGWLALIPVVVVTTLAIVAPMGIDHEAAERLTP
jgi:fatty acid desaturase